MAKKVISFSLEEDLIEMIDKVKKEKKLSSRSAALERILLSKQYDTENLKKLIYEILIQNNFNRPNEDNSNENAATRENKVPDEVELAVLDSMDNIFNNMPK